MPAWNAHLFSESLVPNPSALGESATLISAFLNLFNTAGNKIQTDLSYKNISKLVNLIEKNKTQEVSIVHGCVMLVA